MASTAVKTTAPVKTASAAEAGASARRKTPFLPAMTVPAEGAGANAGLAARLGRDTTSSVFAVNGTGANIALTTRLGIAASSSVVAGERLWRPFGAVVNPARGSASIESVAVIKRPALRVISLVVVDRVMVVPIASPVMPAPPVAPKEPDAEPNSEEE